jgi:hypothetical protein
MPIRINKVSRTNDEIHTSIDDQDNGGDTWGGSERQYVPRWWSLEWRGDNPKLLSIPLYMGYI